jgi:Raf kinase inhibitor-like YbhB/YbcL family protein
VCALTAAFVVAGCGGSGTARKVASIDVGSAQFEDGGELPRALSCDGAGTSPELRWSGVPPKTREIALLVDDPDAGFEHWTLWGIDPKAREIQAGQPPSGSKQADNDAGTRGWTGPCPPEGDAPHHYVFTVRALDEPIDASDGADAGQARDEIDAATIAEGKLTGTYGR